MNRNWILVATASKAELYSQEKPGAELAAIREFSHDESRVLRQDLASDKPGRSYDSVGGGRHGMDPENSVREEESRRFAKEVVDSLEQGLRDHEFEYLTVVAEPRFLGCLRKAMSDDISKSVEREIAKNLVGHGASEIRQSVAKARAF